MNPKQRNAWERLTPNQRRLLMSHRPDELERAESLRAEIVSDLETEFGPRQWEATLAVVAEGESEEREPGRPSTASAPDGETYEEIGRAFDLSPERIRQIEAGALQKLRRSPLIFEMRRARPPSALERARLVPRGFE